MDGRRRVLSICQKEGPCQTFILSGPAGDELCWSVGGSRTREGYSPGTQRTLNHDRPSYIYRSTNERQDRVAYQRMRTFLDELSPNQYGLRGGHTISVRFTGVRSPDGRGDTSP